MIKAILFDISGIFYRAPSSLELDLSNIANVQTALKVRLPACLVQTGKYRQGDEHTVRVVDVKLAPL